MKVAQLHVVADLFLEVVYQIGADGDFAALGTAELADGFSGFVSAGQLGPAAGIKLESSECLRDAGRAGIDHTPAVDGVWIVGA